MKNKKNIFSILEKIEKNKMKKKLINIKHINLQKDKILNQLETLTGYKKEYLKKMHEEMILGINVHYWANYNSFILILDKIIQENLCVIENNTKIIKENLKNLIQNYTKLQAWIYLKTINKKNILKKKMINEQRINDNYIQLTFF